MNHRNDDSIFNHLISGLDSKLQAQLSYMYAHNRIQEEFMRRKEMEQMKQEIINEVLSRITIRLEDEALLKLRDLLNGLGQ